MGWYRREGESIVLVLHVQPGAKRTEVSGLHGGIEDTSGCSAYRGARQRSTVAVHRGEI
jgi:hypothetical protein